MVLDLLRWMEATEYSMALIGSTYMWGILNGIHVLALAVFVGLILFWDLRLMGFGFRHVPVSEIWNRLIPWITAGFIVMAITGVLLFTADPVRYYGNVMFRLKALGLVLAGLNAMAFHFGIEKKIVNWDTSPSPPLAAKIAGASSMALWFAIIFLGRLIAYNWFEPLV